MAENKLLSGDAKSGATGEGTLRDRVGRKGLSEGRIRKE